MPLGDALNVDPSYSGGTEGALNNDVSIVYYYIN